MFTRSVFGSISNRTTRIADKSYSVRSELATKSSAALSVLSLGSFFIVNDLSPMHITGANRSDQGLFAASSQRKHNKHISSFVRRPNTDEAFFLAAKTDRMNCE